MIYRFCSSSNILDRKILFSSLIHFRFLSSFLLRSNRNPMIGNERSENEVNSTVESTIDQRKSSSSITLKIFENLGEYRWTFDRRLTGIPMNGTVRGDAQFDRINDGELLYKEQGKLRLSSMNSFDTELDVTQKYIYHYDCQSDSMISYFVENLHQRGSLFHQIRFDENEITTNHSISARGEHLCGQDHYSAFYSFHFNDQTMNLSHFQIKYLVKGPKKDYLSQTTFHRS